MQRIGIVTDSTADIPPYLVADLGISVIPCYVHFGNRAFHDGVDLTPRRFNELLLEGADFPRTAAPPIGVFAETYRSASKRVDHIVSIHVASRLSALANVAKVAAEELPELDIHIVDSNQVSMCTGWLAIAAARAARDGCSLNEIKRLLGDMIPRLRLFGSVQDLRHLKRSGRVGWASALIGTMLRIKPLVLVRDGHVQLVGRVRSRAGAITRLAEMVASQPLEMIMVLHLGAPKAAALLAHEISRRCPGIDTPITEAGVAIGTHAGPGALGVAAVLASPAINTRPE